MTKNQCVTCKFNKSECAGFYSDGTCGDCDCGLMHHDTRVNNFEDRYDTLCPAYQVDEGVLNRCNCGGHPIVRLAPWGLWFVECNCCISSVGSHSLGYSIDNWNANNMGVKKS